jgi:hypothetical protein
MLNVEGGRGVFAYKNLNIRHFYVYFKTINALFPKPRSDIIIIDEFSF